jgi:hypothetical protein
VPTHHRTARFSLGLSLREHFLRETTVLWLLNPTRRASRPTWQLTLQHGDIGSSRRNLLDSACYARRRDPATFVLTDSDVAIIVADHTLEDRSLVLIETNDSELWNA